MLETGDVASIARDVWRLETGDVAAIYRDREDLISVHCTNCDMRNNENQHHKINAKAEAAYIELLLLSHVVAAGQYHVRTH